MVFCLEALEPRVPNLYSLTLDTRVAAAAGTYNLLPSTFGFFSYGDEV